MTPDHPVLSAEGQWVRPDALAAPSPRFVDYLYNVALSSLSSLSISSSPSLRSSQVRIPQELGVRGLGGSVGVGRVWGAGVGERVVLCWVGSEVNVAEPRAV